MSLTTINEELEKTYNTVIQSCDRIAELLKQNELPPVTVTKKRKGIVTEEVEDTSTSASTKKRTI
jgi:F0F1-type ATP synthase alpha subunit